MNKTPENIPPGAGPKVQGYYAYSAFGQDRNPPSSHAGHTEKWQAMWLQGYDEALKNEA